MTTLGAEKGSCRWLKDKCMLLDHDRLCSVCERHEQIGPAKLKKLFSSGEEKRKGVCLRLYPSNEPNMEPTDSFEVDLSSLQRRSRRQSQSETPEIAESPTVEISTQPPQPPQSPQSPRLPQSTQPPPQKQTRKEQIQAKRKRRLSFEAEKFAAETVTYWARTRHKKPKPKLEKAILCAVAGTDTIHLNMNGTSRSAQNRVKQSHGMILTGLAALVNNAEPEAARDSMVVESYKRHKKIEPTALATVNEENSSGQGVNDETNNLIKENKEMASKIAAMEKDAKESKFRDSIIESLLVQIREETRPKPEPTM